jgi:hypothetical protein
MWRRVFCLPTYCLQLQASKQQISCRRYSTSETEAVVRSSDTSVGFARLPSVKSQNIALFIVIAMRNLVWHLVSCSPPLVSILSHVLLCREEKFILILPAIEPRFLDPPVYSLIATSTEVSQLLDGTLPLIKITVNHLRKNLTR